ncbi:MAG: NAD(+) diphosphatase [Legionellales bacterium]|jgi:NADH pyrophosphatase NudC (nudix superfamily)
MNIFKTIPELGKIPPQIPCLFYHDDKILVLKQNDEFILPHYQQLNFILNTQSVFFMDADDGTRLLVADLSDVKIPGIFSLENTRNIYHYFNAAQRHWIAKTYGYVHWYRNHRFCGRCAHENVLDENECAMVCPNCRIYFYPKVNPSMIVLVHRGPEILLARSPHFSPGLYSVLAGFVAPGETLEQTVMREVKEEVNITVKNISYQFSQAWPFPDTFMLGFYAEYAGGELQIDKKEIEDAGWYMADNLPELLPRSISIGRQLIDNFYKKQ